MPIYQVIGLCGGKFVKKYVINRHKGMDNYSMCELNFSPHIFVMTASGNKHTILTD